MTTIVSLFILVLCWGGHTASVFPTGTEIRHVGRTAVVQYCGGESYEETRFRWASYPMELGIEWPYCWQVRAVSTGDERDVNNT